MVMPGPDDRPEASLAEEYAEIFADGVWASIIFGECGFESSIK